MGLLDDLNESLSSYLPQDPQKREALSTGLLSMGAAMLGAQTKDFGRALGAGLQGGVNGYTQAYEMAQKTGLQKAQMKLLQNQDARTQKMMTLGEQLFGGQAPAGAAPQAGPVPGMSMPSAPAQGNPLVTANPMASWSPQAAPPQAPQASPGGFLRNMNPDQAVGWQMMGGQDLLPALKLAKEGIVREQGKSYIDPYTGKVTSLAKLDSGQVQNDDGSVANAPGYTQAAAANAGAITGAQEAAKAPFTFQTVTPAGGRPTMMTTEQLRGMVGSAPLAAPAASPIAASAPTPPQSQGAPGSVPDIRHMTPDQQQRMFNTAAIIASPQFRNQGRQPQAPAAAPGLALQSEPEKQRELAAVTQETKPTLDYSTDAAKNLAEKGKALSGQVAESQELLKRIEQSRDALTRFKAGGGAETRSQLAQMAQSIPGVPQKLVDGIAGGDLSAATEFQKYAAQEAMQTMRQALASDDGKGSQGNRMAMQLFSKNNPNLDTDPRAIEKIFNFQTQLHNQLLSQQDHFVKFTNDPKNPKDLTAFDNSWAHKAIDSGIIKPEIVTGAAKGLPDSPAKPKGAPLKGQTVGGYKFKGGDPSVQSNWEKQ